MRHSSAGHGTIWTTKHVAASSSLPTHRHNNPIILYSSISYTSLPSSACIDCAKVTPSLLQNDRPTTIMSNNDNQTWPNSFSSSTEPDQNQSKTYTPANSSSTYPTQQEQPITLTPNPHYSTTTIVNLTSNNLNPNDPRNWSSTTAGSEFDARFPTLTSDTRPVEREKRWTPGDAHDEDEKEFFGKKTDPMTGERGISHWLQKTQNAVGVGMGFGSGMGLGGGLGGVDQGSSMHPGLVSLVSLLFSPGYYILSPAIRLIH